MILNDECIMFRAVGVMGALKAGVALSSVRRPLGGTVVVSECVGGEESEEVGVTCTKTPGEPRG